MARTSKKPRIKEASAARIRLRVEELLRIRLDGAEFWDCQEYVREQTSSKDEAVTKVWGKTMLSQATIYRYLEQVDALIEESCKEKRRQLFRKHLAKRRNLHAKAVLAGDYRTALAVLKDEAEMLRFYGPKKLEMTGKHGAPLYPTLEEMVAALAKGDQGGGPADGTTDEPRSDARD